MGLYEGEADAADVQRQKEVSTACLEPVSELTEPAELAKMEGDKSQHEHLTEGGHRLVSNRRYILKTQSHHRTMLFSTKYSKYAVHSDKIIDFQKLLGINRSIMSAFCLSPAFI